MAADGVDFVDEDDAGRVLLGLLEHVAHARGADADEHLDEVGARNGEERHVGFARDRARDQGLAGAGRPDQQHAARNPSAEPLVFSGVAQELDDLLQILFGLVDAGDVLEGDAAMRLGQHFGARFAKAHRLAGAALHLARQEHPHADQRDERQPGDQQRHEPRHIVAGRLRGDRDLAVIEPRHQRRIVRRIGLEARAVGEGAVNLRPLDHHVADVVGVDLGQKLRERDILRGRALTRILEEREQCQQQQDNNDPEGEIAQIGVHRTSFVAARIAALCPWVGTGGIPSRNPSRSAGCNLGAAPIDAKGTAQDYLAHLSRIPVQIMAAKRLFSRGG